MSKTNTNDKSKLKKDIKNFLQNQMMFGDTVSSFEMALQCMFTDWNDMPTYNGKDEDRNIILNNCKSLQDILKCLNHHKEWNFMM